MSDICSVITYRSRQVSSLGPATKIRVLYSPSQSGKDHAAFGRVIVDSHYTEQTGYHDKDNSMWWGRGFASEWN